MIWLASYPRSGNTFLRNLLYHYFQLESSAFPDEGYDLDKDTFEYPFVKTHQLPDQLPQKFKKAKSIYIVRDGRDAIVSSSFHRINFIEPNSDFNENMVECSLAIDNSYFGGWSQNVYQWVKQADLVIRFEDLINDPLVVLERLQALFDLSELPSIGKLSFEDQQKGRAMYGTSHSPGYQGIKVDDFARSFFRRGTSQWSEIMPTEIQDLFWIQHGHLMDEIGYSKSGEIVNEKEFQSRIFEIQQKSNKRKNWVLIEGTKLEDRQNDGISRYTHTLISALHNFTNSYPSNTAFDVKIMDQVLAPDQVISPIQSIDPVDQSGKFRNEDQNKNPTLFGSPGPLGKLRSKIGLALFKIGLINIFTKINNLANQLKASVLGFPELDQRYSKYSLIHYTLPQIINSSRYFDRHVVTIHDLTHTSHARFHEDFNIRNATRGIKQARKMDANLLCVSQTTRDEVSRHPPLIGLKTHVVFEAIDHRYFRVYYNESIVGDVLERFGLANCSYLLILATNEPRKNIKNMTLSFLKLLENDKFRDIKLVVAGNSGWMNQELPTHPNISKIGYISDGDLGVLYNRAIAFCYVSHWEGFGLPPLEAMRCKTVPIYGDNSSMKEIIGNCGLPARPDDIDHITCQMALIIDDPILRKRLEEMGYRRSLKFNPNQLGIDMLNYYSNLVDPKS